MAEFDDRLIRCFSSVFPALTEIEIRSTDAALLYDLDSLAGVTLLAVIQEEFAIELDVEDLLALGTFQAIHQFLRERSIAAESSAR
jgi:acyl carrier protein